MKRKKIITICSSATFYPDVLKIEKELKKLGFQVKIPKTARIMERTGNYDVESYKVWFKDPAKFHIKKELMDGHFKKVIDSDAILVVNRKKKGIEGYIGGNVLMEMVIAYHYKKPIFILETVDADVPYYEEVIGLGSIFINEALTRIKP